MYICITFFLLLDLYISFTGLDSCWAEVLKNDPNKINGPTRIRH